MAPAITIAVAAAAVVVVVVNALTIHIVVIIVIITSHVLALVAHGFLTQNKLHEYVLTEESVAQPPTTS